MFKYIYLNIFIEILYKTARISIHLNNICVPIQKYKLFNVKNINTFV